MGTLLLVIGLMLLGHPHIAAWTAVIGGAFSLISRPFAVLVAAIAETM